MNCNLFCRPFVFATLIGVCVAITGADAQTINIFFDGDEPGVEPGAGDFSFEGANFNQGSITGFPDPALRASDPFSWLPQSGIAGNATIVFDIPVTEVSFFYAHDGIEVGAGAVGAFEAGASDPFDFALSNAATFPGDPNNFVTFTSKTGITMLEFAPQDGLAQPGSVDNFSFTLIPSPAAIALLGLAGLSTGRRRRRLA